MQSHLPQHQHTMRRGPREFSESDTMFHGRTRCCQPKVVTKEEYADDHITCVRRASLNELQLGHIQAVEFQPEVIYIHKLLAWRVVLHKFLVYSRTSHPAVTMLTARKKPRGRAKCKETFEFFQGICVNVDWIGPKRIRYRL